MCKLLQVVSMPDLYVQHFREHVQMELSSVHQPSALILLLPIGMTTKS